MENNLKIRIILGIITFFAGIFLLVCVFVMGFQLFHSEFVLPHNIKNSDVLNKLTSYSVSFFVKIVSLVIMTCISSVLSNKGINLIFKSK